MTRSRYLSAFDSVLVEQLLLDDGDARIVLARRLAAELIEPSRPLAGASSRASREPRE